MVLRNRWKTRNIHGVETQAEAKGPANLPLRESGDTLQTPLICVIDQLMFRKMKTDTDPQNIKRPSRPRRFVLIHREFYVAILFIYFALR